MNGVCPGHNRKVVASLASAHPETTLIWLLSAFLHPGGIGEAVSAAVVGEPGITVTRLAVAQVPRSGKPAELLKMFGIDKDAIAQAVRGLVAKA